MVIALIHELISSFILHIMYVRSHLPLPFAELSKQEVPLKSALKMTSADRKKLKTILAIKAMISSLQSAVRNHDVITAAILLGPSANNPKEVYFLHFETDLKSEQESSGDHTGKSVTERQISGVKRQLIHKLIEHHCNQDYSTPTRANVFLALQVKAPVSTSTSIVLYPTRSIHQMEVRLQVCYRRYL